MNEPSETRRRKLTGTGTCEAGDTRAITGHEDVRKASASSWQKHVSTCRQDDGNHSRCRRYLQNDERVLAQLVLFGVGVGGGGRQGGGGIGEGGWEEGEVGRGEKGGEGHSGRRGEKVGGRRWGGVGGAGGGGGGGGWRDGCVAKMCNNAHTHACLHARSHTRTHALYRSFEYNTRLVLLIDFIVPRSFSKPPSVV